MSTVARAVRHETTEEDASSRRSFVTVLVCSLLISVFGETLAYTRAGLWGVILVSIVVTGLLLAKKRLLATCLLFSVALNVSEYSRDILSNTGFYSMRTVVFMGNCLANWLLILTAGVCILTLGRRKMKLLLANGFIRFWSFGMLWFVAVGAANCVWAGNPWSYFLAELVLPVILLLSYVIVWCQPVAGRRWMATVLMTVVLARPFATVLAHLLHFHGGVFEIATYAPLSFFGVAIFGLLFAGKQHAMPRWIVWSCVLAELYVLTFQLAGKDFFTLAIVILLGVVGARGWQSAIKVAGALAVVVLLILMFAFAFSQGRVSSFASEKVDQALSLLIDGPKAIFDPEWAYAISASPQVRVLEFTNIVRDLAQSPLDLLFGRGAGGSFSDWRYPFVFVGSAFSATQWETGRFYAVHESLNVVLLKFGVAGLIGWVVVVLRLIRRLRAQSESRQYFLALCTVLGVLIMLNYSGQIQMFMGAALGLAGIPDRPLVASHLGARATASALPSD